MSGASGDGLILFSSHHRHAVPGMLHVLITMMMNMGTCILCVTVLISVSVHVLAGSQTQIPSWWGMWHTGPAAWTTSLLEPWVPISWSTMATVVWVSVSTCPWACLSVSIHEEYRITAKTRRKHLKQPPEGVKGRSTYAFWSYRSAAKTQLVSAACPVVVWSTYQTFVARTLHLQSRSMGNIH